MWLQLVRDKGMHEEFLWAEFSIWRFHRAVSAWGGPWRMSGFSENQCFIIRKFLPFSKVCIFPAYSLTFLFGQGKDWETPWQQELSMTCELSQGDMAGKSPYRGPTFWGYQWIPTAPWLFLRASLYYCEIVDIPYHSALSNSPCRDQLFLLSTVNGSNLFTVHTDPIRQGGDKEPHLIIQSATAFLWYPCLCYNHGTQTLGAKQTCGLAI